MIIGMLGLQILIIVLLLLVLFYTNPAKALNYLKKIIILNRNLRKAKKEKERLIKKRKESDARLIPPAVLNKKPTINADDIPDEVWSHLSEFVTGVEHFNTHLKQFDKEILPNEFRFPVEKIVKDLQKYL